MNKKNDQLTTPAPPSKNPLENLPLVRIQKELWEVKTRGLSTFRVARARDSEPLFWQILLLPDHPPYDQGAFRVQIEFPFQYPFKPPIFTFMTKIYHPNIDEKGQVCIPYIKPENWRPATRIEQIIEVLLAILHRPDLDRPLRIDVADQYKQDKKKFNRNAEDYTKQHAEERPEELPEPPKKKSKKKD
nr:unnamed protein product [Callosobruchus chinensis]